MKKPSNFIVRTITGTLFVAVILASIVSEFFWIFTAVMSVFWILMFFEYRKLLKENGTTEQKKNLWYSVFAYFYIILPLFCLLFIYSKSMWYALALFSFIWINDTFAYLVGITIGKHKLWPKISPKKSWEGFFGGLLFTVLAAILFCHLFMMDISSIMDFTSYWFKWIGLAIIIVISATFGDLFESAFKRSLNVKDSGTILPGHGGLLDRFDSILFAAPAYSLKPVVLSFLFSYLCICVVGLCIVAKMTTPLLVY
jgi:phosphatidate cytidylyltransferase